MSANAQALRNLLEEIVEFGAVLEDKGINTIPSFDPLLEKAQHLGVDISAPTTLDALREAVENACAAAKPGPDDGVRPAPTITAKIILGNESGIPGDGP